MRQDVALVEGVELVLDEGASAQVLPSVCAMKLAARCWTRRYRAVC